MDNEQREHYIKEFERLDGLRLDHAKLTAKVEFIENELRVNKSEASNRFERLESKMDDLATSIHNIKSDVKDVLIRVGGIATFLLMVVQIVGKHLGIL